MDKESRIVINDYITEIAEEIQRTLRTSIQHAIYAHDEFKTHLGNAVEEDLNKYLRESIKD